MTEPHAGADPAEFTCRAELVGDEWVINGEKWYASHADFSRFLLVVVVTDTTVPIHKGASILIVDRDAPGLELVRNVSSTIMEDIGQGVHGYLRFTNCRIPKENILGKPGQGFEVAQTRLGGGRIHHAMRTVGQLKRALDMMCERSLSRRTKGELLSQKQLTQEKIADSYIQITQFRLHVLYAAWLIDKHQAYTREVRREIAAVKSCMPMVLRDVVYRALHLHGSLGLSNEIPLLGLWQVVPEMGIVDGPTEVHKFTVAKEILRERKGSPGLFPTYHLPERIAEAERKLAASLELEVGNL
jgi:acyl-CoA dehydrogenase